MQILILLTKNLVKKQQKLHVHQHCSCNNSKHIHPNKQRYKTESYFVEIINIQHIQILLCFYLHLKHKQMKHTINV